MKILYGCCYKADLDLDNVDYVDIIPGLKKSHNCNYICDTIENINFNNYDIIICSPPCNYYSRANWRRDTSDYSLNTKHLLPYCIKEAIRSGKPFIIENVRSPNLFKKIGLYDLPIFIYTVGRHTYFTNLMIDLSCDQIQDNIHYISSSARQGGFNVNQVFKVFLQSLGVVFA